MKMTGSDKVKRMMRELPSAIEKHAEMANRESAEDMAAVARALIPSVTGENRAKIRTFPGEGTGHVVDFGDKAKVIEGDRGPRPFVNPAIRATKDSRRKRAAKAARDAIKEAANG